jgi:hypothetical protein
MNTNPKNIRAIDIFSETNFLPDSKFERVFHGTVSKLNDLLHTSYLFGKDGFKGPVGRMIGDVLDYHDENQRFVRDWEAFRIGIFAMQLEAIKQKDEDLFRYFRRKLRRISEKEYFGFRLEVQTVSIFYQMNIKFRKRESPDFSVEYGGAEVFVECCSINLDEPRSKDVSYKVMSALTDKGRSPYANKKTALFLDYTNIFFNSVVSGVRLDLETLSADIKEKIDTLNFGAIILEANLMHIERKGFSIGLDSIYSDGIEPVLSELLKHMFPENRVDVSHSIPFSI